MGRTIAYCRVSSRDQNPELQVNALTAHGYDQMFAEKESGKRGVERPAFTKALATLQAGDTLVFWKSDRWGRSAAHVLTTINELRGCAPSWRSRSSAYFPVHDPADPALAVPVGRNVKRHGRPGPTRLRCSTRAPSA
jgi:DNA invertase Pin-like site-specific DNA recombinase